MAVFNELTWDVDGFAVAAGYDDATGRYEALAIPAENTPPQISDTTLLVHPGRAKAQREVEHPPPPPSVPVAVQDDGLSPGDERDHPEGGSVDKPPLQPQPRLPTVAPAARNTRFYGTVRLDPERFGRDLNRLYQEVIQHLAAPEGVDLEITVEIRAVKQDGFPEITARIVSENARTLKFDQSGFEDRLNPADNTRGLTPGSSWLGLRRQLSHGYLDLLPSTNGCSEYLESLSGSGQCPDPWHICLYLDVVHASKYSLELELLGAAEVAAAVPHGRRLELCADHQVRNPHEMRAASLQFFSLLSLLLNLQRSPSVASAARADSRAGAA